MRPGPQEIILIIVVIIAAIVIARVIRTGRSAAKQEQESSAQPSEKKTNRTRGFLKRGGIAFILIGVILFLAVISMLRWVFQGYIWSFIMIVTGFVMLLMARKKT